MERTRDIVKPTPERIAAGNALLTQRGNRPRAVVIPEFLCDDPGQSVRDDQNSQTVLVSAY
jgi:hypothetical protein